MKKILSLFIFMMAVVQFVSAQNCPDYASTAISPTEACGNQIYYLEVENTGCNGTITFDVFGNYGDFGNEITWEIVSTQSGNVVASGGPGTNNANFGQTIGPLDPAIEGNYFTITVYDSWGDGFNGGGFIQVDQGGNTWAYQDAAWSADEWSMTFGTNIDISSSTITVNTPSGPVVSTADNCLDHEVAITLANTNFCTPVTVNLPWTIVCDVTSNVLSSGTETITVYPQLPTSATDVVDVTWNPGTCQWDVTAQNDCDAMDIGTIFTISPDPASLPVDACAAGSETFTVDYLGIGAGPDCCSTGGPLSPITYTTSQSIGDATVQSSPFGGTNNSAYLNIPANGTGGNGTSLTLTVDMSGYCFDPPGTSTDEFWVTVYVDGIIIHDQMYTLPPNSFSETFDLTDIPAGYNENSVVEVYIYPNSFSAGTPAVNTTYVPGVGCAGIGDGQWTASSINASLDVTFDQLAPSAANCGFPLNSAVVCCTPSTIVDDNGQVCSGAGTDDLSTWQGNVTAANPNCLVFSSVTPVGGSTLPDNNFPDGVNGGATQIVQSVSAYSYCDANGSGTIDAGDTYTLLSTYDLTVDPVEDASFTVTPNCGGGTATVTGTAGGTFSFNTPPGDGATIDPSTGTVTNGSPSASYDILYTTAGACPNSLVVTLNTPAADDPTFTMTPTCDGGVATVSGTSGGTFSFAAPPADGATIDPSTGTVMNGTPGASYDITYTTSGSCPGTLTITLTANTADDPTFTVTPTCDGGTASISGTPGGSFSFVTAPGDGAVIDPATGTVTGGTPGASYDIQYATSGVCAASSNQSLTALSLDDPTFTMTPTCDGGTATVSGTAGGSFSFNAAPTDGATIDATSGTITGGSPGGSYDVLYTTNGACPSSLVVSVVAYNLPPAPVAGVDSTYCATWELDPMTASGTGGTMSWYLDTTASSVATGDTYIPANDIGATVYYVTETLNGCEGPASMVTITIQGCDITIPTAVTPNGDLSNDSWEIVDLDVTYPNNSVQVFNRWGNLVFEHNSNSGNNPYSQNQWDGTYEGNPLPVGSYYYIITFNDPDNGVATGSVSIILDK